MEGVIRTVRQLDREKIEVIRLALVCEDQAAATQKQTATATLTIQVQDINDNDPKFRKSFYRRSVAENAKTGTTVVNVVADDVDKNRTITYSLHVRIFGACCLWISFTVIGGREGFKTKDKTLMIDHDTNGFCYYI